MALRAVLFDLDGTLVDTSGAYRQRLIGKALRDLGVDKYSKVALDSFWFGTNREDIIRKEFGLEPKVFWRALNANEELEDRKKATYAFDDVYVLRHIKSAGKKIGLVTGSPIPIANIELELVGKDLFDQVVVAQKMTNMRSKPAPDGLLYCCKQLKVNPSDCIFIGNANEDVMAAKNAGIEDVLIIRGNYTIECQEKPTHIIHNLHELVPILKIKKRNEHSETGNFDS